MEHFTRNHLNQLLEPSAGPKVSLYMPTHRAGREVQQNSIRFKNFMKDLQHRLDDLGEEAQGIQSNVDDAMKLCSNDKWWQHQSDGLAMFLSEKISELYRLPSSFEEFLTIGPRFHILPLIRLLQGDGRFFVLAVSQNRIRLLQGTHYSIEELEADQLPSDLRSALNIDEYTSALQQHSTGGPVASGSMTFHGQGASDLDVRKQDEIAQYFHHIDRALNAYLDEERIPLVFAGVEYLFPIFRDICKYDRLVEQPVTGNPDELSAEELHSQAWRIAEPIFSRDRESALAQCLDLQSTDAATAEMGTIIQATQVGAVQTLLLAESERGGGAISELTELAVGHKDGAEELLNRCAIDTFRTGGVVYMLPLERMPQQKPAGALLRFPVEESKIPEFDNPRSTK